MMMIQHDEDVTIMVFDASKIRRMTDRRSDDDDCDKGICEIRHRTHEQMYVVCGSDAGVP